MAETLRGADIVIRTLEQRGVARVRRMLPFVAIVGNDACWNAESQLQRRHYGESRMHGCGLLPARYDAWASALGAQGEFVTAAHELGSAIARAIANGRPAVVNVMTESIAAPVLRREV